MKLPRALCRHGARLLEAVKANVAVRVADVAEERWDPRDGTVGDRSQRSRLLRTITADVAWLAALPAGPS